MPQMQVTYHDAGRISYSDALELQRKYHNELTAYKLSIRNNEILIPKPAHHLIFCEHNPVFTMGKSGKPDNLLYNEVQLKDRGIEYFPTNRGGDITYHGPGQIVGYPIFDLDDFYHDVHRYVRDLEEVIIRTMKEFSIITTRLNGLTGVWIQDSKKGSFRKICAIGVHISRWVTMHGFALNVNTELDYFNGIVPCGISDPNKAVTSMNLELMEKIDTGRVKKILVDKFEEVFGIELISSFNDF
jgi:lipoyl(octanoyl) transferase